MQNGSLTKSLSELDELSVDMLSIILLENSGTRIVGKKMVTPRGYLEKCGEKETPRG